MGAREPPAFCAASERHRNLWWGHATRWHSDPQYTAEPQPPHWLLAGFPHMLPHWRPAALIKRKKERGEREQKCLLTLK
jgi:hypothetical protein